MIYNTNPEAEVRSLLLQANGDGFLCEAPIEYEPICPDGSDRRFYRLHHKRLSWVALVSPRKKQEGVDENDSYLRIGSHLHDRHIPVPRIVWSDTTRGYFLLEDAGEDHLQRCANAGQANLRSLYQWALGLLVHLHRKAPEGFDSSYCYDTALYDPSFVYTRELEYFRKAFAVDYLGAELSEESFRSDFENLAEAAGVHKTSLVFHRDFQSRNIMVYRNALKLLDFQGMRFGPPTYDLASLLIDPYVTLPRYLEETLVELYWLAAKGLLGGSRSEFIESYKALRLCRNLQALGAYGFLGGVKGKKQFLQYIPRAWKQLHEWINGPCRGKYPTLQAWINTMHESGCPARHDPAGRVPGPVAHPPMRTAQRQYGP
jgi:aminoglycoside/choline kinase family phosphotransferase